MENLEQLCDCKHLRQGSMEICLAGIGMGSKDGQTQEVQHAIKTADILLGAERMIERYSAKIEKRPYYMTEQILPYLEQLQKNGITAQKDPLRVTVLFSRGYRILQRMQEAVCGIAGSRCRRSVERRSTDPAREFLPWPHWRPEWEKVMKMPPF